MCRCVCGKVTRGGKKPEVKMSSVFDDPFLIAATNARTRALSKFYHENMSVLDRDLVESLYIEVAKRYRPGATMVRIIELVLDLSEPFESDEVRGAYKIAIGMAGHEVRKHKAAQEEARRAQLEELEWMRFAPTWAYEQEM